MSSYYAVKVGKVPGIYRTWPECQAQVNGFAGAKFQKFVTLAQAEAFLGQASHDDDDDDDDDDVMVVFVKAVEPAQPKPVIYFDGGCRAKIAGAACYLVPEKRVLYQRFTKTPLSENGVPTNNHAELHALYLALSAALKRQWFHVEIRGDSKYAMKVSNGENQAKTNLDLVARNRALVAQFQHIEWVHVKGHSKETGNELVDKFATRAILEVVDENLHEVQV